MYKRQDKKSDKGFKDALLWESVLEFALKHPKSKIIYYSKDNAFGNFLLKEFTESVADSLLFICKNEDEVKTQLEMWAKEIDKYSYQPIEDFDENKEIVEWLNSEDFITQIMSRGFGLVENGRLISSTTAHLIDIDNIECMTSNEDSKEYYIEGVLQVIYELRDGGKTSETINVGIEVTILDDSIYFIECAYRIDDEDDEGDEDESEV